MTERGIEDILQDRDMNRFLWINSLKNIRLRETVDASCVSYQAFVWKWSNTSFSNTIALMDQHDRYQSGVTLSGLTFARLIIL